MFKRSAFRGRQLITVDSMYFSINRRFESWNAVRCSKTLRGFHRHHAGKQQVSWLQHHLYGHFLTWQVSGISSLLCLMFSSVFPTVENMIWMRNHPQSDPVEVPGSKLMRAEKQPLDRRMASSLGGFVSHSYTKLQKFEVSVALRAYFWVWFNLQNQFPDSRSISTM